MPVAYTSGYLHHVAFANDLCRFSFLLIDAHSPGYKHNQATLYVPSTVRTGLEVDIIGFGETPCLSHLYEIGVLGIAGEGW